MSTKINFILFLLLYLNLPAHLSYSGVYYISPVGKNAAKGTENDPIALEKIEDLFRKNGGGDTYIFLQGDYIGRRINLFPENSGTPQNPTVLKSKHKYKARLHGSPFHNIYVRRDCRWVIIDGFTSSGALSTGIKSNADYTVIRNCRIHNNSLQGIEAHDVVGTVIENNLIEYNGKHPNYDHGIYANGKSLIVRNNIIRFNASCGLHMSPQTSKSIFENNLIYGNFFYGVFLDCPEGGGANRIVNNTIVQNGLGIGIKNANTEVIVNNIIFENTNWKSKIRPPLFNRVGSNFSNCIIDYNLWKPAFTGVGPHSISADPDFLDPRKGVFYLNKNSPAIGKGLAKYVPVNDFWGNKKDVDKPVDIGCFRFDSKLLLPQMRDSWYFQWPFYTELSEKKPDFWKFPD